MTNSKEYCTHLHVGINICAVLPRQSEIFQIRFLNICFLNLEVLASLSSKFFLEFYFVLQWDFMKPRLASGNCVASCTSQVLGFSGALILGESHS